MSRPIPRIIPLLFLVAAIAACGPNASLRRHAYAAQVLEEVSKQAKDTVLGMYRDEVESAAAGVADPDERARRVATARASFEQRHLIDAANALIEAKDAYVRAVLLAAQDDAPAWTALVPVLKHALDAYEALRRAMGAAGDKLPKIPSTITSIAS